jgi:hypothetical protein
MYGHLIAVTFTTRPASRTRYPASLEHLGFMDVQFLYSLCYETDGRSEFMWYEVDGRNKREQWNVAKRSKA